MIALFCPINVCLGKLGFCELHKQCNYLPIASIKLCSPSIRIHATAKAYTHFLDPVTAHGATANRDARAWTFLIGAHSIGFHSLSECSRPTTILVAELTWGRLIRHH